MITTIIQTNFELIILILSGITTLSLLLTIYLIFRVHKLTKGSDGKSLESTIRTIQKGQKDFYSFEEKTKNTLKTIQKKLLQSIQGVATTRYDAFGGGGKQSSTTALLNEKGDGVVITSMKANDRVSVYTKPIVQFDSEHSLSEEEDTTIKKQKNNYKENTRLLRSRVSSLCKL
jgi:hypothetical protein